jgi:hypothetical protein
MPHLDGNWLGVYPTSYPEKYSTADIDDNDNILKFVNKDTNGYDNAFIGLASIWDFDIFWKELESNTQNGEIVSAFDNLGKYPSFKAKHLHWLDTGNLDDLNKAKEYFRDHPLSLYKTTDEITYKENKFIKFNPDEVFIKNKAKRANVLKNLIPSEFSSSKYFISYNWEKGETLYQHDNLDYFIKFLDFYNNLIQTKAKFFDSNVTESKIFYIDKTTQRKNKFIEKFGKHYAEQEYIINGTKYNSLNNILDKLSFDHTSIQIYDLFHGDLQFDNILFDPSTNKFTYIDWRESFAGNTKGGDL